MSNTVLLPAGKGYSCTVYPAMDLVDQDTLYKLMTVPTLLVNFKNKQPGFFHVEKLGTDAIRCEFLGLNTKEIKTISDDGLAVQEVTCADTAELLIMLSKKMVLTSGNEGAAKSGLYHLANCASLVCKPEKPQQAALLKLLDAAIKIWSVKYTNIKHTELKEVTFKGALDERFPMAGDISNSDVAMCDVAADLNPHGVWGIRVSKEGRIVIRKNTKQAITVELLASVLTTIFG